ncbi:MAG: hypothetical protein VSS75_007840 [Candidatus Parabeggiatoa sp.]|nr:hypothetical protein [Candidatus Parabeggiatoa sp.]
MKYPNLDCQLYFMFRTHLWRDGELYFPINDNGEFALFLKAAFSRHCG